MYFENQGVKGNFGLGKHKTVFQAEIYAILSMVHKGEDDGENDLHLLQ